MNEIYYMGQESIWDMQKSNFSDHVTPHKIVLNQWESSEPFGIPRGHSLLLWEMAGVTVRWFQFIPFISALFSPESFVFN